MGLLTSARRPSRKGYKGGMLSLEEAYQALGWGTSFRPLLGSDTCEGRRGSGSSSHTLLELYLDLAAAPVRTHPSGISDQFVLISHSRTHGTYLLNRLRTIHERLGLNVDVKNVIGITLSPTQTLGLRGYMWASWSIFCDHWVKETEGHVRLLPPYSLVRKVIQVSEIAWEAQDRDGRHLMLLTTAGVSGLLDSATCPIVRQPVGVAPVSFPPMLERLRNQIRLLDRFEY